MLRDNWRKLQKERANPITKHQGTNQIRKFSFSKGLKCGNSQYPQRIKSIISKIKTRHWNSLTKKHRKGSFDLERRGIDWRTWRRKRVLNNQIIK